MATNYKSHAKCRLTFRPRDRQGNEVEYSDRTVIELRLGDDLTVTLLAKDVPKANAIIFTMKLKRKDQYRQARAEDDPDEIQHPDGTYFAVLDEKDRNKFHDALEECYVLIEACGGGPVDTAPPPPRDYDQGRDRDRDRDQGRDQDRDRDQGRDRDRDRDQGRDQDRDRDQGRDRDRDRDRGQDRDRDRDQGRDRDRDRDQGRDRDQDRDRRRNDDKPPQKRETVLSTINQLVESIKQGDGREAGRLAGVLAGQHVRLQGNENAGNSKEETIPIRVTIDRANANQKEELIIDVYPSTTVRELRAVFEYSHQIRPVDQYWFVNGHLAHESSSMGQLQAVKDTLFILFTI